MAFIRSLPSRPQAYSKHSTLQKDQNDERSEFMQESKESQFNMEPDHRMSTLRLSIAITNLANGVELMVNFIE
jgi:hypothetical protein